MDIALVANRDHPEVVHMLEEIKKLGHRSHLLDPKNIAMDLDNPKINYDLFAVKVISYSSYHSIAVAEAAGIPTINHLESIKKVKDKIFTDIILRKHKMPRPRAFFAESYSALVEYENSFHYPMILKPFNGSKNEAYLIHALNEVQSIENYDLLYLQEYIPNDGYDRKVYVIGEEVYGILRPSPLVKKYETKDDEERREYKVQDDVGELALKCGEIFDLEVYGVDFIENKKGEFKIIDINDFPGFRGVKNAGNKIARYLIDRAHT